MNGMYPTQAAAGGQVTAPTGSAIGAARSRFHEIPIAHPPQGGLVCPEGRPQLAGTTRAASVSHRIGGRICPDQET